MEESDSIADLARRLQSEFCENHFRELCIAALFKCRNHRQNAEDLLQDTFVRIIRGWKLWQEGETPPVSYAKKAMERSSIDSWRRQQVRRWEMPSPNDLIDLIPSARTGMEPTANHALRCAVENLPARHRSLIEDLYYSNPPLSLEEYAVKARLAIGTAYNYHSQALAELRKALTNQLVVTANEEGQDGC